MQSKHSSQHEFIMGHYGQLLSEFGQELGFAMEDNRLVLHLGDSRSSMRKDVQNIGNDMRQVMQRVKK